MLIPGCQQCKDSARVLSLLEAEAQLEFPETCRLIGLLTLTWLEMAVVLDQSARCGTALDQSEAL
jgi:hypothetical protein